MEITTDPVYDSYIFNIVNDAAASCLSWDTISAAESLLSL